MKKLRLVYALLLAMASANLSAQDYFQQEVHYNIKVTLHEQTYTLSAEMTLEYVNHSPDTLKEIWMHLWPNAYRDGHSALAKQMMRDGDYRLYYAKDKDRGYIDSLNFKVDGENAYLAYDAEHQDIGRVALPTPLPPGGRTTLSTPFRVKVPSGRFSRLGHIGHSFQITQWYPKPAVYDRDGWHQMPYLNQGEFYSEFGSFDVSITVPDNYVLGATGDLQNGEKEIEWLNTKANETEQLIALNKLPQENEEGKPDMEFPPASETTKTLRYVQNNVHDFAWFCDKRYHVLKGEVALPHSKRKVTTWAFFTNREAELWKESIEYLNDATYYYSLWNGDYPYEHVTAVDGTISAGGGMEYPNITVIGGAGNALGLETVIMHEVGHNWFYGILGSNERTHAWMDEGINSFNENRYIETKYPDDTGSMIGLNAFGIENLDHKGTFFALYQYMAARNFDQPIDYHSNDYLSINYGGIVYGKSALVFDYLKAYLGTELFDRCMQTYFERWKFKHPQPEDLRAVFEEVTGKSLDWFFDDVVKTTGTIDYKIAKSRDGLVTVSNRGEIAGPFSISELDTGGHVVQTHWFEGFEGKQQVPLAPGVNTKTLRLDANLDIPEVRRHNNSYRTSGLLRKFEKPRISLLARLDEPQNSQLFVMPLVGWNESDKMMAGMAFYNSLTPQRKFEYVLAPMYAFGSQTPTGYGELAYNIPFRESKLLHLIRVSGSGSKFTRWVQAYDDRSEFMKIAGKVDIRFKQKTLRSPILHRVTLRSIMTQEHYNYGPTIALGPESAPLIDEEQLYHTLTYHFKKDHLFHPIAIKAGVESHEQFTKASVQAVYTPRYNAKGNTIEVRLFAGSFLSNDIDRFDLRRRTSWQMTGQAGDTDYLFDGVILDRGGQNDFLSQQFIDNQGAFKAPTAFGTNDDWILSCNIKMSLPLDLKITKVGLFADAGLFPITRRDANGSETKETESIYDFGIYFPVIKGVVEVYMPLTYSSIIKDEFDFRDVSFGEQIRFTFNLHKANPFRLLRNTES